MIIYIHGFNSAGNGSKVKELEKLGIDIISPTLPLTDINKSIKIVSTIIEENQNKYDNIMLIGSSIGGFIARYLSKKYNTMVVLINPVVSNASSILQKYIGENVNYVTKEKYILTEEDIKKYNRYETPKYNNNFGTLVLLDRDDKVIDINMAIYMYKDNANVKIFNGGSHRFDHIKKSLPIIKQYYHSLWL